MRRLFALLLVIAVIFAGGIGYYAGSHHLLSPAYTMASADCATFPQTGKTVCGRFLEYWQQNGGLAQQGLPLSDEFKEVSSVNQIRYWVSSPGHGSRISVRRWCFGIQRRLGVLRDHDPAGDTR